MQEQLPRDVFKELTGMYLQRVTGEGTHVQAWHIASVTGQGAHNPAWHFAFADQVVSLSKI
jgi:hypothetical protein